MTNEREVVEKELAKAQRYAPAAPDGVVLVRGDAINPEPLRWLWAGWLALGKFAMLAGTPGVGKTTVALHMAATVTVGGTWPDGSSCPAGDVLIWSGEDDPADTLLPRLIAAGANRSRVHFVGNVRERGKERPFDPATDMPALLQLARCLPELRFIVVDPVVSAVAGDSHKNTEVRRGLQPLVDFAHEVGASLLGITHFSKGAQGQDPAQRVTGSIAFTAVARVVLVAAKVQDEQGERHVLARSKSNVGIDEGGFTYELKACQPQPGIWTSRVQWCEAVAGSARELLMDGKDGGGDASELNAAKAFLRERLGLGVSPVKTLQAEAKEAGFSLATVRRAATALQVIRQKGGMKDGWYWKLPHREGAHHPADDADDAQEKIVSTFETFEHQVNTFENFEPEESTFELSETGTADDPGESIVETSAPEVSTFTSFQAEVGSNAEEPPLPVVATVQEQSRSALRSRQGDSASSGPRAGGAQ